MKKIILAGPTHFGILHKIQQELNLLGYETQELFFTEFKFKYKNFGERLYNLYRKTIHRDYAYKDILREKAPIEYLTKKINKLAPAEYGLIIRPDMYPIEVIKLFREKVNTLIAYQWDGLNRYPNVLNYIDIFDKFYIFDPADTKHPNVLPTTNFHMNSEWENKTTPNKGNKVYYVGSFEYDRWPILKNLSDAISNTELEQEFLLATYTAEQTKIALQNKNIKIIDTNISYKENLEKLQKCSTLLDLQNNVHSGISFRLFEAIGYDKKVITTNKDVKLYDFYSPEHILVWENQPVQELIEFIKAPNVSFPKEIKEKYSLNNWIKYMLKIDNYIPIDLPLEKRQ